MSEEAKDPKKTEAASDAGPRSDKTSKIVLILTGVNLLVILGIGGVLFTQFQKEKHKESVADIQPHAEEGGEKAEGEHGGGHGGGEKAEGEHGGGHGGAPAVKKGDQ
ncbi:MAG: hypothetical protein EBX52_08120, partial [Proteobacteria bacterium]|nr:hypothetical protein [Pseudomonadota bacterium]